MKNALRNNRINVNNAARVSSLDIEEQDKFINQTLDSKNDEEQITSDDVVKAIYEQKPEKKKEKPLVQKPKDFIDGKVFKQDMQRIQRKLNIQGIQLTESQYAEYCRHITGLKKLFNV